MDIRKFGRLSCLTVIKISHRNLSRIEDCWLRPNRFETLNYFNPHWHALLL